MNNPNVIFNFEGTDLIIQCSQEDKIKDICQKYATKINKNINSLIFLYGGKNLNLESSYKDTISSIDKTENKMNVLVNINYNVDFACSNCGEIAKINTDKLDDIILHNNNSKNSIIGVKKQIENIISKDSNNPLCVELINIKQILTIVSEDMKKNSEKLSSILNDNNINTHQTLGKNNTIVNKAHLKLKNIKSNNIIRTIFSYIDERIKLKTVKYNKNLQNKLDIELSNYKLFSGKYIIFDNNGKGKEYNGLTDDLIFEGEYLKGERNGKGKEYDENGNLIFEGEYLNGKRNGNGKEYNKEGKIKFEGEYYNGLRNGTGKEYNDEDELIFEGTFLNGKRNGKGKEYESDQMEFEVEYLNGKKWSGKKYDSDENIIYDLNNGKGYLKEYFNDGQLKYEGNYLNGKRNGLGKEYYYDGNIKFEGQYKNGNRWKGCGYNRNNEIAFEIRDGKGYLKEYYNNGVLEFEGEYSKGNKNGKGIDMIITDN